MGDVVSLDEHRTPDGEFCLSIRIDSDGKVMLDKDLEQLATKEQVNWAISQIAIAIHDLVEYKNELQV